MPTTAASPKPATQSGLVRRMVEQAHTLRQQLAGSWPDEEMGWIVEAAVCAAPILAAAPRSAIEALPWLMEQLTPWEQESLGQARGLSTQHVGWDKLATRAPAHHHGRGGPSAARAALSHPTAHLYEPFLHRYSASRRKRRGVFFTPQPIADYIVSQVDCLLRDEGGLSDGLAADSALRRPARPRVPRHSALPFVIDPACGTGVFLLTALDHIHRRMSPRRWNEFVPDLLQRLVGIEILPAAALLAKLNITLKLAETGYDFKRPARVNIIIGDALSPAVHSALRTPQSAIPILLGNPPFSSLSTSTNPWITRLVRGDKEVRGYVRANGQSLGERKTWLHDDYVKFIRLAQWHVEQAGAGIVGFVTNHGYLDNATFRLMRQELLRVFPRVQIVDLHGNRKKHEVAPGGRRDENVFHLDQGVAIGLFCRPRGAGVSPAQKRTRSVSEGTEIPTQRASEGVYPSRVEYAELWGPRHAKLASITDPSLRLRARVLNPQSPAWRFIPSRASNRHPEYDSAWSLADAMPVNTTAPVTARDHFVVAFTVEELQARIEQFRDLSISDDEIRRRFFTRTRSARYELGDTRGWKLSEARRIVAEDADWQRHIVRCLYRPFDWRYVFWHPAMIDWPRHEVTRHLIENEGTGDRGQGTSRSKSKIQNSKSKFQNLCLLARRQQLPTQPCTFFWIADGLALDGVIRSDNRGSESLFPLYVVGTLRVPLPNDGTRSVPTTEWQANFAPAFVEQFVATTRLAWQPLGRGDLEKMFGPDDLLAYIYALFHAPRYRERYADPLRSDFPRVLAPHNARLFGQMSRLGRELINFHLLRRPNSVLSTSIESPSPTPHSALRTPHFPDPVANFRAGGYVALRKWLQPKHRSSADAAYGQIARAIERTVEIMQAIDEAIARSDGFERLSHP